MPDVGRLRWILQADTRQFESGMNRARRSLMRLGRLAAGFVGARGLSAGLAAGLQTADAIGKIARAAGVATDDIQQLRFAFQEAGGDMATFDRLLLNFNRSLGDLRARHAGQLATFLRETDRGLFLNLKQAEDTTEAFLRLADAAAQLEPGRRAALLGAAFGRQSRAMNVLVQGGRPGIRAGMARLPSGELLSDAMIAEAERTNDQILRLQERSTLAVARAATEAVSIIRRAAESVERLWTRPVEEGQRWLGNAWRSVVGAFRIWD